MLGQVLVLRTAIRQRADGGSETLLLLAGAVGVVGGGAVTRGHLEDMMKVRCETEGSA